MLLCHTAAHIFTGLLRSFIDTVLVILTQLAKFLLQFKLRYTPRTNEFSASDFSRRHNRIHCPFDVHNLRRIISKRLVKQSIPCKLIPGINFVSCYQIPDLGNLPNITLQNCYVQSGQTAFRHPFGESGACYDKHLCPTGYQFFNHSAANESSAAADNRSPHP